MIISLLLGIPVFISDKKETGGEFASGLRDIS
jgi:hypothetical protein